jgi:uncharacterized protein (TIGR02147 family)
MKTDFKSSKEFLHYDYSLKRKKNSRFSMRSYALHLGLSNGRLTEMMNGKAPITEKRALAIVAKLFLSDLQKKLFLRIVENENQSRSDGRRKLNPSSSKRLHLDEFALISDWEYFALMALIETSTFRSDVTWISRKLNIGTARCEEVLGKLQRLGYVQVQTNGSMKNNYHALSTLTDIPSTVLRKANKDCILQSLEKMDDVDVDMREISSLTLPTDVSKMKAAKTLIRKFKDDMTKLCETENSTEIYNLNIQFVPVSELGV